jgi:hypothetical protein
VNNHDANERRGPDTVAGARHDQAELDELHRRIRALGADLSQADERLRTAVQERPLLAIAAAVAVGFVVGRVVGRG